MSDAMSDKDVREAVARAVYSAYVGLEPLSTWDGISARDQEMHRRLAAAAITAYQAALKDQGLVIVPVEATAAMCEAGGNYPDKPSAGYIAGVWTAMLSASQPTKEK